MSSEARVQVIKIDEIEKHGNADSLGIVTVHGGYPVCVRLSDWRPGMLAAYIPVDSVVDLTRPEFNFLDKGRIKAKRLRGVFSMGLLIPAPDGSQEGDDVTDLLGVQHWDPELNNPGGNSGEDEAAPKGWLFPTYTDIEPFRRHKHELNLGESVIVTEKIHGANARFAWDGERLWVGSRTRIKRQHEDNMWWRIAERMKIAEAISAYPYHVFFGEVFGQVQDLRYGVEGATFRVFDVFNGNTGRYLNSSDAREAANDCGLPWVPVLYEGPWDPERVNEWAEGQSKLAEHVREGFVVKPIVERVSHMGRVILKMHGEGYLTRKGG